MSHGRNHGCSRTGFTRRRHSADSISPGGTRGLAPNADQRGALPALGLAQWKGPIQGYGGAHTAAEA